MTTSACDPIEFDPLSPDQLRDPYPFYAYLRRNAPICYHQALDAWTVARYDDVCEVLKDSRRFSATGATKVKPELPEAVQDILQRGIPYARTLLDNDPPGHTRFRTLLSKVFVPQRIRRLAPTIHAITTKLVNGFIGLGEIDIVCGLASPLPIRVIASILGLPADDLDSLKLWCDDWMHLQSATASTDQLVACAHNYLRLQDYFTAKIEQRQRRPQDDLICALIQAQSGHDSLSKEEFVRLLMSLLVAGHETTTHSIGNTLALLLQDPKRMRALTQDTSLVDLAVAEGLRMDPPIQSMFRRVVSDTELRGVRLPAGARLMLLYGSANRDEQHFENPDVFDLFRGSASRHISFSRGVHFCLGSAMAEAEARIALQLVTTRLHGLRLVDGQPLSRVRHFFLRGYENLYVRWDPNG